MSEPVHIDSGSVNSLTPSKRASSRQIFTVCDVLAGLDALDPGVIAHACDVESCSEIVLRSVLSQLAAHASWEHADCYPSQAGLALDVGADERTVRRGLDVLECLQLIARHRGGEARRVYGGALDNRRLAYTLIEWRARRALQPRAGEVPARMRRAQRDAERRARRREGRRQRAELQRLAGVREHGAPELPVDAGARVPRIAPEDLVERLLRGTLTVDERAAFSRVYGEDLVERLGRGLPLSSADREVLRAAHRDPGDTRRAIGRIEAAHARLYPPSESPTDTGHNSRENLPPKGRDPDASGRRRRGQEHRPRSVNTRASTGAVPRESPPDTPQR